VEVGESLEDAVRREVAEELAQRVASGSPFGRVDSIGRLLLQSWL